DGEKLSGRRARPWPPWTYSYFPLTSYFRGPSLPPFSLVGSTNGVRGPPHAGSCRAPLDGCCYRPKRPSTPVVIGKRGACHHPLRRGVLTRLLAWPPERAASSGPTASSSPGGSKL